MCRKLGCTKHAQRRVPFAGQAPTRERRPGYDKERRRRRDFVLAELRRRGRPLGGGVWVAVCTTCGREKRLQLKNWTADHVVPVCGGGREQGVLRLSCAACQRRQGGLLGADGRRSRSART